MNNTVKHHGILGMKWGVRNGPPYPIGASKKSIKQMKVGAVVQNVSSMTTTDAMKYIAENPDVKIKAGKLLKRDMLSIDDLPKTTGEHNLSKDLANTNPNYRKGLAYKINCSKCAVAFELRRRGFDVEAAPSDELMTLGEQLEMFEGAKTIAAYTPMDIPRTIKKIEAWGNGARGMISAHWTNSGMGHNFSFEVIDKKVQFFDPQNGMANVDYLNSCDLAAFTRTDKARITNKILDAVRKRG